MRSLKGLEVDVGHLDVSELARSQQLRNARIISFALTSLSTVGALLTWLVGYPLTVVLFVLIPASGMALAHLLTRRGHLGVALALLLASIFFQHIGAVWAPGRLGPTPFVAPVAILVTAATSPSFALPYALLGCLVTLGIEGALVPWTPDNQGTLGTAGILALITFVVSLLHSRGIERAFAVAREQALARDASAREALESERRVRLVAEAADDLIALMTPDGEIVFMSDSHERVLSVPRSVLRQGRFLDHLEVENRNEANASFHDAMRHGHGRLELRVRVPGRGRVLLDVKLRSIEWQSEKLLAVISRDVTEQRALQERLHSSERLEALGRLAGSVAHDFNNLLTVIQGSTEIALARATDDRALREDLDAVLSASSTAADIARQLLTFSRRQLVIREPTDVGATLVGQQKILERLLGDGIVLEYCLAPLPLVTIPKVHIEQLAMNFAANARDAMPRGGRMRIAGRVRKLGDREVGDLVAGGYVALTLEDTGEGIDAEVQARIFEPFYSTKGNRGTGLGLATCHAIVTQAGGTITVDSRPGRGATFTVLLPVTHETQNAPNAQSNLAELRRVLVVDDDDSVRDLVTRMLKADGLGVITATSGSEALAYLEDPAIALDGLITDIVLGEERGTDLLVRTRKVRPHMRILVISGYTPQPEAVAVLSQAGAGFLPKPFGRDQLRKALDLGS